MTRQLVHLNALRALEATARLGSFTRAAGEMGVTPAAVGQQVRILENYLGGPVFRRTPRGLEVLPWALQALQDLEAGFDRIGSGLTRLRETRVGKRIAVSVAPALAARWLAPRLQELYSRSPQIDLRIDTSLDLVDIDGGEFDLAIRYTDIVDKPQFSDLLFDEYQIPVCLPSIVEDIEMPMSASRILELPLLHIEPESSDSGIVDWGDWGAHRGLTHAGLAAGPRYPDSTMALQAALNGQGIALCGLSLVIDNLCSGQLVAPLGPGSASKASYSYRLLYAGARRRPAILDTFVRWLKFEAAKTAEQMKSYAQPINGTSVY